MSHLSQTNIEKKKCVWTTKYKRLLEMCIVQHVEMKRVFTFQPIKRLVSTTVKIAKPSATFSIFPFKEQKPTNMLFGSYRKKRFARKASGDYEKEKPSLFFEEILPPITTKHIRT